MIDLDDFRPELIYPYDPRYTPQPPPTVDVCASPAVTICMNTEWWAHVSGMISRLAYYDAWTGTDDEKHAAIESIYKILDLGRPNMACGCGCGGNGTLTRYNDAGVFQTSNDGGTTWVDAPNQDPRNNVTLAPPLPGADGDSKKCQVATNIRGHLEHLADQQASNAEAYGEITLLIAAFAALAIFLSGISLGTLTPLLLGVAGAMLTAGQAAFEAAMTTAVFDDLECLLYCNMQSDGTFTDANLSAIKAGIADHNTGMAETWLYGTVNALGKVGLANMGRTGSGLAADCSDCECGEFIRIYTICDGTLGGTEVSYIDDTLTVDSVFDGSRHLIRIVRDPASPACVNENPALMFTLPVFELVSGTANFSTVMTNPTNYDETVPGLTPPNGFCAHRFTFASFEGPFTARFKGTLCP